MRKAEPREPGLLQRQRAAVAADQLGGDDQAEAGAALPHAAAERLEQVLPRLLRQPGAGVGDPDLASARPPRRR